MTIKRIIMGMGMGMDGLCDALDNEGYCCGACDGRVVDDGANHTAMATRPVLLSNFTAPIPQPAMQMRTLQHALEQQHAIPPSKIAKVLVAGENMTVRVPFSPFRPPPLCPNLTPVNSSTLITSLFSAHDA
jgi:hypothetical protein